MLTEQEKGIVKKLFQYYKKEEQRSLLILQ